MARNINTVYELSRYIIKKERGIFYKIQEFNQNLDAAMFDAIDEWWSQYGVNQRIHDAIKPLRVYQPFTSDSSGFVSFPSDYIHLIGSPFTVYGSAVTKPTAVNEDELPFALTSQLRPVTMDYPLLVDTSTGINFYPQETHTGAYFYLRRHKSPVLAYTQVGRVITYDPTNSVQIELNEVYWNNIIAKSMRYVGINMSEADISQFAELYNAETK